MISPALLLFEKGLFKLNQFVFIYSKTNPFCLGQSVFSIDGRRNSAEVVKSLA